MYRGGAYVPFCGDADIAKELYNDRRIYAADIDAKRVEAASKKIDGQVKRADCSNYPFNAEEIAIADFDAYSEPYTAFRSFWENGNKTNKLLLIFTDGHRQGIIRTGWWHRPDGKKEKLDTLKQRRKLFNVYLPRFILPWFEDYIKPYKVYTVKKYLRKQMIYWGAIIEK